MKKFLSLLLSVSFLSTSTHFSTPSFYLASHSPMQTLPEPSIRLSSSERPAVPQSLLAGSLHQAKEAVGKAAENILNKNPFIDAATLHARLVEAARPFVIPGREEDFAPLIVAAYFDIRPLDRLEEERLLEETAAQLSPSQRLLVIFMALLVAFLPVLAAGCVKPFQIPADNSLPNDVTAAVDQLNGSPINHTPLANLTLSPDQNLRYHALNTWNGILDQELGKTPENRRLNVLDLARTWIARLPIQGGETEYPQRLILIECLGKSLSLLPQDAQAAVARGDAVRQLTLLYFFKREQLAALPAAPAATEAENVERSRQNYTREIEKIEQALGRAGRPVTFSLFYQELASFIETPQRGTPAGIAFENNLLGELRRRVRALSSTDADQTRLQPSRTDTAALVALYQNNALSSDTDGDGNKLWRLNIVRNLANLVVSETAAQVLPVFRDAAAKTDPYRAAVLQALERVAASEGSRVAYMGDLAELSRFAAETLANDTAPAELRAAAGRALGALQIEAGAIGLQQLIAAKSNSDLVNLDRTIVEAYLRSLEGSANEIRADDAKRLSHLAQLRRILDNHGNPALRASVIRAILPLEDTASSRSAIQAGEIPNPELVNALLINEARAQSGIDAADTAEELKTGYRAEVAAINEALPRLGFKNDYRSLKLVAANNAAPRELRIAMLLRIQRLVENPPTEGFDPAAVLADAVPLADTPDLAVGTQALKLIRAIAQRNAAVVAGNNAAIAMLRTKAAADFRDHRIEALQILELAAAAPVDAENTAVRDAVLAGLRNEERLTPAPDRRYQDDEMLVKLGFLNRWGRNEAQRSALDGVAIVTTLVSIVQDNTAPVMSAAVKNRAIETALLYNPNEAQLRALRAAVPAESPLLAQIDSMLTYLNWTEDQRRFYGGFRNLNAAQLETFLSSTVTAASAPALVTVLEYDFRQRSGADKTALAFALLRLNHADAFSYLLTQYAGLPADKQALLQAKLREPATPADWLQRAFATPNLDSALKRAILDRAKTQTGILTPEQLRGAVETETNAELMVLAAEALVRNTSDQSPLAVLRAAVARFDTALASGVPQDQRYPLMSRLTALVLEVSARPVAAPEAPKAGEKKIGRVYDEEVKKVWSNDPGYYPDGKESFDGRINERIETIETKLAALESSPDFEVKKAWVMGVNAALVRHFRSFKNQGAPADVFRYPHAERYAVETPETGEKSAEAKRSELFELGRRGSVVRLPQFLFAADAAQFLAQFEGAARDEAARLLSADDPKTFAEKLGRLQEEVLLHEILEGAEETVSRDTKFTQTLKEYRERGVPEEAFHTFLVNEIQAALYPESSLRRVLQLYLSSRIARNARLDALKIAEIAAEGAAEAAKTLAAFAELESPDAATAKFAQAAGEDLKLKVAAEFVRPGDAASLLSTEAAKASDANALIVVDAAALNGLASAPEWLTRAVAAGRVVFFGSRATELFPVEAFVANAAELEGKARAGAMIERVVALLTPDQMRTHYAEYGLKAKAVDGKDAFVAPLNPAYGLTLHFAFANALLEAKFDVKNLSEAGRLLLGLQLDSLNLSIADMRGILYELGQIPSELIRDAKEELRILIQSGYLPALKA